MEPSEFGPDVCEVQEELVRLNLRIKSLIDSFGDVQDSAEMESLNLETRDQFELMRCAIDRLRELARTQTSHQTLLSNDADGHSDQLASCHRQFRKANLSCIARLDQQNRHKLMETDRDVDEAKRRRRLQDKEALVKDSGRATDQMAAISRQLAATVERSARTMEELTESSKTMEDAHVEFKGMGGIIAHSRKLITKYGRRETTDKFLIFFTAVLFFAVVFYVLRKRVLGPLDPFALVWSTITTTVAYLIRLFYGDGDTQKSEL